ncbi:MAG: transglycosylase SLT domain-containing protein, partial [Acidobacteria bacterium]|nr:transglycosylase SLT domain-containing protein [Acidobacteriota bacterium]
MGTKNSWIGVALAAALLAWGCAAVQGPRRQAAPSGDAVAGPARDGSGEPAPPPSGAGTRSGSEPAGDPGLESLLIRIQERTASALAAFEAGETDSARAGFHECLDLILDSGHDLATTPRLRAAFLEVMERMNATDLTLLPEPAPPEEGLVAAAGDALAEIDPDQPPAEPDSDRSRARRETEEIPFDVPVVVNDAVLSWIEIYQTALRDRFEEGLRNSGRFLPMIRKVFTEEGLPRDLAHMAHVESSYKPRAYSRAQAMGIWQFIRSTGRLYGLQRDD